jgi:hypothetical protein
MATVVAHLNVEPSVKQCLREVALDLASLRTAVNAAAVDLGVVRTAFNTAMTKLNADAGVTDVNYAAAAALTVAAVGTLNVQEK